MNADDRERIEQAVGAWRPRGTGMHPDWADLDAEGRREVFEQTRLQRAAEAALDPDGLSATGRRVLALIAARKA